MKLPDILITNARFAIDFWNFFENRLTGIIDEIVPFKAQITETITYMIMLYSRFSQSANKLSSCNIECPKVMHGFLNFVTAFLHVSVQQ